MKIHTMPQRSPEWFAIRIGKITGSSFTTMANGTKAGVEKLCCRIVSEIKTGVSSEKFFTNDDIEHGVATEPEARRAYETTKFVHTRQVGFIELDELIGFSPDSLIDGDGGLEIKCPQPPAHQRYLGMNGKAWKADYRWQVQGALWGMGRDWWDFVSYCPEFPPDERLLIERVLPDFECIEKLESGADYCRKRIKELLGGA